MVVVKKLKLFAFIAVIAGFTSCSSDDNDVNSVDDPINDPTAKEMGSFNLANVPLDGKMISVENFTMPSDGWIVVRRDDGHKRPMMSEIISIPKNVLAGRYPQYAIELEGGNLSLQPGERLWVNLHADDGDQIFSYNGNSGDMPLGIFDPFSGFTLISQSFIVDLPSP